MAKISKKQVLDLLYYEPIKIAHWCGFDDMGELQNKWLRWFLYEDEDLTLLAHRGSYKTTTLSLFLAIIIILKPNVTVIFFRKTDSDVVEILKQVLNILQSSVLALFVRVLYGCELIITVSNSNEISTNLSTSTKGTSQLSAYGIKTSITGKHADIVVTDDIVNITDRISHAERQRTKLAYMELENIKNRGGRFINTGTPWHKDDAISSMPNVKRFDCYQTGMISKEQLQHLKSKMTSSLFAANYELRHIADEDAIFTNPNYIDDFKLLYNGNCHIDASYGGSDSTAFTCFKKLDDGRIIGFGKLWNKHVDDCIDEIKSYYNHFRLGTCYVEDNGDKGYLKNHLVEQGIHAQKYHESMNKFIKIVTYLKKEWSNVYWLDTSDSDYMNQILDYSEHAQHDDAPDSAASLIRKLTTKGKFNKVKGGI